jgi:hypothetical protein
VYYGKEQQILIAPWYMYMRSCSKYQVFENFSRKSNGWVGGWWWSGNKMNHEWRAKHHSTQDKRMGQVGCWWWSRNKMNHEWTEEP